MGQGPRELLKRPERRQSLIDAATRSFARTGFTAANMDDIASEAGVSRVLIYRHFDSKADLYQAALDQVAHQLVVATGAPDELGPASLDGLVHVAQQNPAGFRLFFRQAGQEAEFRQHADWLRNAMSDTASPYLAEMLADEAQRRWASALVPAVVIEALIAWLDAGAPRPDQAATTLGAMVGGVVTAIAQAAQAAQDTPPEDLQAPASASARQPEAGAEE